MSNLTGKGCFKPKWESLVVEQARDLREKNGWSITRISKKLGVPYGTIKDWCYYYTRRKS
jgi:hypothetical protein